jgi:hypothetical protein
MVHHIVVHKREIVHDLHRSGSRQGLQCRASRSFAGKHHQYRA